MITTFTKKTVHPLELFEDDIDIVDIAHSLALVNRFGGHTPFPISVAQHSVYVSRLSGESYALQGLLHDASEAYIGDMTKWLKMSKEMEAYRRVEDIIQRTVFRKYGCPENMHPLVVRADTAMVIYEAQQAYGQNYDFGGNRNRYGDVSNLERKLIGKWTPWDWQYAKSVFLATFHNLMEE